MIDSTGPIELKSAAKPYAIIIGLDSFTGLQTARLLAQRGIAVIGIASNPAHACCRTRVCDSVLKANIGSGELIEVLESIGSHFIHKAVLYPCSDHSVLMLSHHRRLLNKWYHLVLAAEDVVDLMMNKDKFYTYAQKHGFSIPGTFFIHNRSDAEKAALSLKFPCILKPHIRTPQWERHTKEKVFFIKNRRKLLDTYDLSCQWAKTLMVQEWIEGPDSNLYSCNCYFFEDSRPPVTFIARKLRQWPPETGTSSLGEECRNDIVLNQSLELFEHFNFRGLGYLEMKQDARSGKHYIIEPNIGRPTGRSAIAEAGGVDLLYTMYCDCLGWPLPKNRKQKYRGVKWIYLRRDLQSAWHYWRQGKLSFKQWWQSMRGRKFYALFSWSDPLPFFGDICQTFKKKIFRIDKRRSALTLRAQMPEK